MPKATRSVGADLIAQAGPRCPVRPIPPITKALSLLPVPGVWPRPSTGHSPRWAQPGAGTALAGSCGACLIPAAHTRGCDFSPVTLLDSSLQQHCWPRGTDWKCRRSPAIPVHTMRLSGWGSGFCVLLCYLGNSYAQRDWESSGVDRTGHQILERGMWDGLSPSPGYQLERSHPLLSSVSTPACTNRSMAECPQNGGAV